MLLELLVSISCVVPSGDTLDVATVSAPKPAAVTAVVPVVSISQMKIDRMGATGLHEVLKLAPGISVKDYGGVGGLKTVSVRNMGASHTSVTYDGMPVSDAQNGQVDISGFDLEDVAGVTMCIGMPDDIFRSARQMTSAGILDIRTSRPVSDTSMTQVKARMEAGSFGTFSPYLSIYRQFDRKYGLKASAKARFSDGDYPFVLQNGEIITHEKRQNSDISSFDTEIDWNADWKGRGRLRAKVRWLESERGLPGPVILYTHSGTERLQERDAMASVAYDSYQGRRWRFHADLGFSHSLDRHTDTSPVYSMPQYSRYLQNEYSAAVRGEFRPAERWRLVLAEDIFVNDLDSNIPECPYPTRISSVTALSSEYAEKSLRINASMVFTGVHEVVRRGESPDDLFRISPMAGVSWNFIPDLHLRASYKEGFRIPTFNDLYYARVGNLNLKPETTRQTDIGITYSASHGKWSLCATLDGYFNMNRNKIVAVPTMFIWKMRNVGKAVMTGFDLSLSTYWRPTESFALHTEGNYSLQYAVDITDPQAGNYMHQLPYTPRHSGSGLVSVETQWVNVSYSLTAVGKRYAKGQNLEAYRMNACFDHGMSANRSIEFGKRHSYRIRLSLEALNLGGKNYEIINYYPMAGRTYRISIRLIFK